MKKVLRKWVWLRKKVIVWLTKDLFEIVSDDIIQERIDGLYIGDKKLDANAEEMMRKDAKALLDSALWQEVLMKPLKQDACKRMFEEGTDDKWDLYLGRIQLHVLETQKNLLKALLRETPAKLPGEEDEI